MANRTNLGATIGRPASIFTASIFTAGILTAGILGACTTTEDPEVTESDYVAVMSAACRVTLAELAALPSPPAEIAMTDFAALAATAIEQEAERIRTIAPPDDLDGDHRAFIANTDDQASRWREIANEIDTEIDAGGAELNRLSGEIAQLTLGRDDLAVEMGISACRRADD
jgi:hypothetical protein